MITIRLQRVGKAKHASYRLIVSDKTKDTHDKYVELLGTYNPHDKVNGIKFLADRIKYWLSVGASTSNTVNNLLIKSGISQGKKKKSVYLSKSRQAKLAEKKKASAADSAKATSAEAVSATVEAKPEAPVSAEASTGKPATV